jgi:DTW domain-containing protein YfiP
MRPGISEHRCPRCEIRVPLCFCDLIPRISLETRLIVLMHSSEEVLTSNSARLTVKALANSEIRIHGRKNERMSTEGLRTDGRHSLLLYPSPEAVELNAELVSRLTGPVNLIVPDSNWRQTRKFVRREPSLIGIQHVKIPEGRPSEYRLRHQPNANSLCTLEAIARAIGILESVEAQEELEFVLRVMVERTLWSRGMLRADQCDAAGIPAAAFQS